MVGVLNDSTHLDATASESVEQSWSKRRELAELFLRACAAGAPCDDLASALAESVLDDDLIALAFEVLEGGEHRYAHATELASKVLDATAQRVASEAKEAGNG